MKDQYSESIIINQPNLESLPSEFNVGDLDPLRYPSVLQPYSSLYKFYNFIYIICTERFNLCFNYLVHRWVQNGNQYWSRNQQTSRRTGDTFSINKPMLLYFQAKIIVTMAHADEMIQKRILMGGLKKKQKISQSLKK